MALRGRNIENFDDTSLTAWSRGLPICVSSITFQKSSIGWPQQPPTERVSDVSEKLDPSKNDAVKKLNLPKVGKGCLKLRFFL